MTKRQRKMLFWASLFFFVFAIGPLLLYSFGYRFSESTWQIVRAGGLSITSVPSTGTKIYVDNKLEKETSFLSRSAFFQGLTPRPYNIKIEKEGFFPWEKTLPVLPERVTEVQALLVQNNLENATVILRGEYTSLAFADTNKTIIALTDSNNREQFFSIPEARAVGKPSDAATSTPPLPEAVESFIRKKKLEHFIYDDSQERLLWWDDHGVWVRWTKGEDFLPLYTEQVEVRILDTPSIIHNAAFYPGQEAVIVARANAIEIVELDGRDKRHIYPLYKGKEPQFIISPSKKEIYLLDDGNLILIPLL